MLAVILFPNITYANTQSHDVTISAVDILDVYDVDINWDNMQFTYIEQEKYVYDNEKHLYNRNVINYWTSNSNNIKIMNESKKNINVNLKYNKINSNVSGTFNKNNFDIRVNEAQNIKLNLYGNIDNSYTVFKTVGEVSIVIS